MYVCLFALALFVLAATSLPEQLRVQVEAWVARQCMEGTSID